MSMKERSVCPGYILLSFGMDGRSRRNVVDAKEVSGR